jgi:signal peptidase I
VTAPEPPNPYAPTDALSHAAAADGNQPAARRPSRLGAVVVTLFAQPIAGAGFYLLGENRRFVAWTALALGVRALLVAAVWVPLPRFATFAFVAMVATSLASVLHTAVTKPRGAPRAHGALIGLLFIAAGIGTGIAMKEWLVESFQIPAGSMLPTLEVGDHILVKKGSGDVQRGDVVVFKFPQDTRTDYIKRVVAVGGDTVEVRGGVLSINGTPLDRQPLAQACSYTEGAPGSPDADEHHCTPMREISGGRAYTIILEPDHAALDFPPTKIAPGELFMLGDNRDNSYDSRRWGTVKVDLVKGKATVIWWSRAPGHGVRWSRVGHGVE